MKSEQQLDVHCNEEVESLSFLLGMVLHFGGFGGIEGDAWNCIEVSVFSENHAFVFQGQSGKDQIRGRYRDAFVAFCSSFAQS